MNNELALYNDLKDINNQTNELLLEKKSCIPQREEVVLIFALSFAFFMISLFGVVVFNLMFPSNAFIDGIFKYNLINLFPLSALLVFLIRIPIIRWHNNRIKSESVNLKRALYKDKNIVNRLADTGAAEDDAHYFVTAYELVSIGKFQELESALEYCRNDKGKDKTNDTDSLPLLFKAKSTVKRIKNLDIDILYSLGIRDIHGDLLHEGDEIVVDGKKGIIVSQKGKYVFLNENLEIEELKSVIKSGAQIIKLPYLE